ncbi:hypothetical protein ColTof4_08882 [Colletotrichum tofieldiae]|nr:hypothetical protein ColTof3_03911 [Colletotrichum tofieldiae]GKT76459.1 hypothetical protein ColTof4_08882 [Colletotrichum tofieldiae]GKT87505.1 hypothetical protein Ct61P_05355 [Colletotrichum tofieldiae]
MGTADGGPTVRNIERAPFMFFANAVTAVGGFSSVARRIRSSRSKAVSFAAIAVAIVLIIKTSLQ